MSENQTIKDRIRYYLKTKKVAPTNFEKTIGAGGSYLNNTKSIGSEKLLAISRHYEDLDIDWLVTGRGEMLRNKQIVGNIENSRVAGVNVCGNNNTFPVFCENLEREVIFHKNQIEKLQNQIEKQLIIIENLSKNEK